jgi:uncharacterized protein
LKAKVKTMNKETESAAWWRYPLVWLVIAGPAVVVLACLATLWLALLRPDPLVAEDYYRQGIEINRTLADRALMPAMSGRNHATTPTEDVLPPATGARK